MTTRTKPSGTKLTICGKHSFSLWTIPPVMAEHIRARWPEMRVVYLPNYDRFEEELPDTDIFVGFSLRPEQLPLARRLKWIHSTATGVGQLMYPEMRQSGIELTNIRGIHSIPMAEHILGMIIAMARRFPDCFRYQQQARWAQKEMWDDVSPDHQPRELTGQIVLLIGFGGIGLEVARVLKPLGMRIWAVTRSGAGDENLAEKISPVSRLHEALPEADFVLLAAPSTPESQHMIGAPELALMKPTAYFLNVARGALVDEPALIAALAQHKIAGAALDVVSKEPLPPESPLWKLDNVFITPHTSAVSNRLWDRQTELVLENLERWFSGRELINRVDFKRGY